MSEAIFDSIRLLRDRPRKQVSFELQEWAELFVFNRAPQVGPEAALKACFEGILRRLEKRPRRRFLPYIASHEARAMDDIVVGVLYRGGSRDRCEHLRQFRPLWESYESRIATVARERQTFEFERRLAEASKNRSLACALADGEWLGLKLLAHLRKASPRTASELSRDVEADVDSVPAML